MEQTMAESRVEEMGVIVDDNFGSEPKMKVKQCNRKIKLFREFALASLCALTKSKKTSKSPFITACDSFAASGIAGLQWKKHLKSQVHVCLADHDDLSKLTLNVQANSLNATGMTLNSARVPGDPFQQQDEKEVHIYRADARAILSMEAFQFIYVNPNKSCAEYIDSAFHSVSHGGVVCFVMSDVSSFGRQPHIVRRQHAARVIKTEYWKEIAARIMLGSMAIAAARCNKGIVPMYVVSVEDYLLVGVKVGRGHVRSEAALNEVVPLLHCRFCEERVFMDIQLAPEENPYSKLPCKCKQSHLGKTAVVIGPMWRGAIYNHEFLCEIQECGTELKLSSNFADVVKLLIAESFGPDDKKQQSHTTGTSGQMEQNCEGTNETQQSTNQSLPTKEGDPSVSLFSVTVSESGSLLAEPLSSTDQTESLKRKFTEDNGSGGDVKKMKKDGVSAKEKKQMLHCQSFNVPFYYNINKIKAINLPKIDKVISIIQNKGFKASRTHFDHSAIRTSARVEQLLGILS